MKSRKLLVLMLVGLLVLGLIVSGCSDDTAPEPDENENGGESTFPEKPVKIIVGHSAGGSTDMVVRLLQPYLQEELGVGVVVENLTGAAGEIGLAHVKEQPADGYVLGTAVMPTYVFNSYLGEFKVDMLNDYDYLYNVSGGDSNVLAVSGSSEFETYDDLVDAATSGRVTVAMTSGISNSSVGQAIFLDKVGEDLNLEQIPYQSGTEAAQAVVGNQVEAVIGNIISVSPLIDSGDLKPLVYFGTERHPNYPDLPTFSEFYEGAGFVTNIGIIAPKGLPEDVAGILEEALKNAVNNPEFIQKSEGQFMVMPLDSSEFYDLAKSHQDLAAEMEDALRALID